MAIKGFIKFFLKRAIVLFSIVVIATYLTVLISNMGGHVDDIVQSQLMLELSLKYKNQPEYQGYEPEIIDQLIEEEFQLEIKRRGLDQPFIVRSILYLQRALTLNLGRALYLTSDRGSSLVRNIILERLPRTLLLFTTGMIINFLIQLFVGLYLSRNYGSLIDKLFVSLSPTSGVPGWFYGIFLILIFASYLHVLPYGGILDIPPPTDTVGRSLNILKHMLLPLSSFIISSFFLGCYRNRTFFLIFSTEDYVEAARARGVPPRQIELKYILKPSLPPIITSFSLSLIYSWSGSIITETVFNWQGLGQLTYAAINAFDIPIIIGVTIIYAYLLSATVLILDLLYSILDPRIKVG